MEDKIFFDWGRYIHPAFLLKVRHQEKPELDAKSFAPLHPKKQTSILYSVKSVNEHGCFNLNKRSR